MTTSISKHSSYSTLYFDYYITFFAPLGVKSLLVSAGIEANGTRPGLVDDKNNPQPSLAFAHLLFHQCRHLRNFQLWLLTRVYQHNSGRHSISMQPSGGLGLLSKYRAAIMRMKICTGERAIRFRRRRRRRWRAYGSRQIRRTTKHRKDNVPFSKKLAWYIVLLA